MDASPGTTYTTEFLKRPEKMSNLFPLEINEIPCAGLLEVKNPEKGENLNKGLKRGSETHIAPLSLIISLPSPLCILQ